MNLSTHQVQEDNSTFQSGFKESNANFKSQFEKTKVH